MLRDTQKRSEAEPVAKKEIDGLSCQMHSAMAIEVRVLGRDDADLLNNVAPGVFDDAIDSASLAQFLADPHHHLVIARDGHLIVGFASGIHYLHPDKAQPEFWINEVGVAPAQRSLGTGRRLLVALLSEARRTGCAEAWVLTDEENGAAIHLYSRLPGAEPAVPQLMFTFALADADRLR